MVGDGGPSGKPHPPLPRRPAPRYKGDVAGERIQSYGAFWPFYLGEHSRPWTRRLHFAGTTIAIGCLIAWAVTGRGAFGLSALGAGYGFAWISHFFVEKNRPATFRYPLWSLLSDFRMWGLACAGRLDGELARHLPAAR